MKGYWITLDDGTSGYCQGESAYDAVVIAEHMTGKKVVHEGTTYEPKLDALPYPATPVIWQFDHPRYGKTPTFCFSPKKCKGSTSCPQRRSCSE